MRLYQRQHYPAISIHALHEESDGSFFESQANGTISIHALHEESDLADLRDGYNAAMHFNPRSP